MLGVVVAMEGPDLTGEGVYILYRRLEAHRGGVETWMVRVDAFQ